MKIDQIGSWEAFREVARHGGYTQAGRVLRLSVGQVSKRIQALEDSLGTRLFSRSTRTVVLTDEGKSLLPRVETLLEELREIEGSFESRAELSGLIRVTSVPFLAQRLLLPVLQSFLNEHPRVKVEVDLTERMVNLVEQNVDLALRIHESPADTRLIYRKLRPNELILCASPGYLKKSAPLKRLDDLANHPLLVLPIHEKVRFSNGRTLGEVGGLAPVRSDNGWFLTELAREGFGVLARARWDVESDLKQKRLVEVLPKEKLEPFGNVYAVLTSRKFLATKVRVLLEMLERAS